MQTAFISKISVIIIGYPNINGNTIFNQTAAGWLYYWFSRFNYLRTYILQ